MPICIHYRKVWNRPTYEKSPISGSDSASPQTSEYQQYQASNVFQSMTQNAETIGASYRPIPPNSINISTCSETRSSDLTDNRQTPAASRQLLPSPTYPKDLNNELLYSTPLKISVRKATKYLGLSKSLGIKVFSRSECM